MLRGGVRQHYHTNLHFQRREIHIMRDKKASILALSLLALITACSSTQPMCPDSGQYRICPQGKTIADLRKEEAERERQRILDQLAAAQKQVADRDREIASVRSSASDSLQSAQADLDQSKTRIGELERQLADRDREIASVQSGASDSLRSAQADLDQSKTRIGELERQLGDRDQKMAALQTNAGDASQIASQLSAANSENAQLSASLATATSEKDGLAAALAAAQLQVAALQAGTGDKDKLAADLEAAKQRVTDLESQLASAQSQASSLQAAVSEKDKLAAEIEASNQRLADLEKQVADRDRQLAALQGDLSAKMAKLNQAQRGIVRALRPEIEQGNITVDLNNERLLINLASSMLFGSGEDQLKPAGVDALKRVGSILKDYPEYAVEVDGHTDNRPIRSSLKKRFPTNKELSDARAVNGVTALAEGGVSADTIRSAGYADTKPVAPNTTDEGRQKNRRVEVRVTPKS
jgi:chemotaxis protein MotB